MIGSLQIIVRFIEVFLLDFDLGDFIKGRTSKMVIIIGTYDLFEVENGIIQIVHLLKCFSLVEISFA